MAVKEWRVYSCEHGEEKLLLCSPDEPEPTCLDGNSPVMFSRSKPSDRLVINIIPMAREFDSVSGRLGDTNKYKLALVSLTDNLELISDKVLTKDEAIELANMLVGLERYAALRVWNVKKMNS